MPERTDPGQGLQPAGSAEVLAAPPAPPASGFRRPACAPLALERRHLRYRVILC